MNEWEREKYEKADSDTLVKQLFILKNQKIKTEKRRDELSSRITSIEYDLNQLKMECEDIRFLANEYAKELDEFEKYLEYRFNDKADNNAS